MANKKTHEEPLTSEQFSELAKCSVDPFFFISLLYIVHPMRGKVRFEMYPYQVRTLYEFITNRHNIVLKFRQAGITELISGYALWLAMFNPHKNVVIISIKQKTAKRVLARIKYMYKNLPRHLRVPIVNGKSEDSYGTMEEMEFSNGSIIQSIPTTEQAGRSEAVSLLIIDEAAIVKWADAIIAAAWPTLSTGGSSILNSTPYGVNNAYHDLWQGAITKENEFNPIRLKWQMHPERDMAWYNSQKSILGPLKTAQELEGDFISTGNTVFDLADIREMQDEAIDKPPVELRYNKSMMIYHKPSRHKRYYLTADIASGRARDFSTICIMDQFGTEAVAFKGKVSYRVIEDIIHRLAIEYQYALVAIECNNAGAAVVEGLQSRGYTNLYYSRSAVKNQDNERSVKDIPGWWTTEVNRQIIVTELEEDVRFGKVDIRSPFFIHEAYTFIYNSNNKPIAMNKKSGSKVEEVYDRGQYHDDYIIATAICNHIRKRNFKAPIILPA